MHLIALFSRSGNGRLARFSAIQLTLDIPLDKRNPGWRTIKDNAHGAPM
ncbi:hypothetical protein DSLASN_09220 [Desulfoluna limicola]|uniref:Uncharacterized protein n=1 Tax=Desulfoluna limicola TaxID=2810562 RepID=A0ABM7PCJ4_9BACT|nr:hypothetical protein DSLASN_09220 [Desulfoluna limicola]